MNASRRSTRSHRGSWTGRSTDISTVPRRRAGLAAALAVVALLLLLATPGDVPRFATPEAPATTVELADGWGLASARVVGDDGAAISSAGYADPRWHAVRSMPATVLQALEDDGTYPNLYFGKNLRDEVPQDLWRQDWWYRTTFDAPAGHTSYRLKLPGINYRAQIWLNGRMVADDRQVVGMYVDHDVDVSAAITRGAPNVLAIRITPERALQDVDGVELADSWFDWINWNYLGYQGPGKNPVNGNSFVADRNAGIWKPVSLEASGPVTTTTGTVTTALPLPSTDSARLTVYATVRNTGAERVRGTVRARISRPGTPTVTVEQSVGLGPGETREVRFSPDDFAELRVQHPDLWWPYTMGSPNLYDLHIDFVQFGQSVDTFATRFGVREVAQFRDDDERFPELGRGGSFYLRVNGRDFLVRGATYTPDLLYDYDPAREDAILGYARDLGLNMLRLESKIPTERFVERADELGIPLMVGWMCCNQWEKWPQWDAEDDRVARESLRSQITMLRSHAASFVWANASDGRPPAPVADAYHRILAELHWPNAVVDSVSSYAVDDRGERLWDGIQMAGPYSWRPPTYWFSGRYRAARGASAEQGDNEHVPPFASLRRFIPRDELWPINDFWYFHAGSNPDNAGLRSIQRAVNRRYGYSDDAEEFAAKAQLAHYESTRAQFEAFAALGWADHKMTIYWMLNNHWPSFFGNLFDYYLRPGGAYFGAKKGLRPLSVVFDSYATGAHQNARVMAVNQSPDVAADVRVRVRTYDLNGRVRDDRSSAPMTLASGASTLALTLPRTVRDSRVFFVRCELLDRDGGVLADNTYWQSQQNDDVGDPDRDFAFQLDQASWADMTALNQMPRATLEVSARHAADGTGRDGVVIRLTNPTPRIAFFARAEVTAERDGDEILPITYDDNYVTVYPGESVDVRAVPSGDPSAARWARVTPYGAPPIEVPVT